MTQKRPLKRKCLVCGKKLSIKVYPDGHYTPGHYFNKMKVPQGKGEYKKVGTSKILGKEFSVVKWTGKEKEIEYWECDACYQEALHLDWFEEKITQLYGKRCKDYMRGCACCDAWDVVDTLHADSRGEL